MLSAYDRHTLPPLHSLSLSLSLSLILSLCCSCLLSPLLTCHTFLSYPLLPPFLLAYLISHHPCPYPFKPPISLIYSNPFLFLCYSLSPFHLTCLLPMANLPSPSPPLIFSSPHTFTSLNLSLLFLSHFFFYHPPTPPFFSHTILQLPLLFLTLTHFSPHSPLPLSQLAFLSPF